MNLNCIAIDDEKYALDLLVDNIQRIPYLNLVGACKSTREAAAMLQTNIVHVIYTDIQLPGLNGLQFIEQMAKKPIVIFITAFRNYAINAFNVDAIDYLVKPVSFERFLQATNKALLFYKYNSDSVTNDSHVPAYLFVHVEYTFVKVNLVEIAYIEALKDYVKIHFSTKKKSILTRSSLKSLSGLLASDQFIRIHKSFIVSVASIATITRDSIILQDGVIELPIGEGYKAMLHQLLKK